LNSDATMARNSRSSAIITLDASAIQP